MDQIVISSYTINLILQYISPPSQLARPIPSDLLSRSLLQRHALLEISPQDPSAYLTWPSPDRDRAIHYLESLQMPLDDLAPNFIIRYSIDPEHAYAHVHIKPTGDDGLRLVFEWDGEELWKYHDSALMPFPPGTRPFLDHPASSDSPVSIPTSWNSYGAEDYGGAKHSPSSNKSKVDVSEDAYWARYAAVQGTADSTLPSPRHKREHKLEIVPVAHHISREEIIPTLNSNIHSRLRDPKAPPSPTTLAHRLTDLSPRPSPLSYRHFTPRPEEDNLGATDDSSEPLLDNETSWEWGELRSNRKERNASSAAITDTASSSRQRIDPDVDNRALQDAVRGLFWLWKTRPRSRSPTKGKGEKSTEELDKAEFLHLVGRAITTSK